MGHEQEERHAGQALDQKGEVVLRRLVDPVEILDDHDQWAALAPGHGQRPDGLEGFLPLVLGVHLSDPLVLDGKAKQRAEHGQRRLEGGVELTETLAELFPYLQRVVLLLDLEVRPQHLEQRQIRCRLAVGDTVAREPGQPLALERLAKFVEEARLPCPRLADDPHHLPVPRRRAREPVVKQLQLPLASDQRSQSALGAELEAGSRRSPAGHPIGDDRVGAPLDVHLPERLAPDIALRQALGGLGDHDGPGLGEGLHPSRQVGGVADRGVVHPEVITDPADDDQPAVETQAQADLDAALLLELLAVSIDRLADRQRRLDRARGMILEGHRGPEQGHQAVTEELVHRALVAVHRLGHQPERVVHELVHGLRIQTLGQARGLDDVAEQHGHLLALALERASRHQDLLGEVLRGVCAWRAELWRWGRGLCSRPGAFGAKLRSRGERGATVRAGARQRGGTFLAELGRQSVLVLAPGTLHAAATSQRRDAPCSRHNPNPIIDSPTCTREVSPGLPIDLEAPAPEPNG